ncbi:DUF4833 domain-containing protein [Sphingobacterium sp.]|uniref:DUF4833 domain-containing protein n=1 Tax=Sphingobacterium sp. TaxID=341027 RepID=UPI0028A9E3AD|nr:DUF4833 domain-containing protein [Sphingobacterium sp.]
MNRFILSLLIFVTTYYAQAQEGYPTPTNKENLLFYIQHNRGKNTFIYDLNKNGSNKVNEDDPIRVYRQIFDKSGEIRPLTGIQKNFAYGIEAKPIDAHTYEATIVSLPSQKFYLTVPAKGKAYVVTTVNGLKIKVNRIFIRQKDGTSGLTTKVDYILFYGTSKNKEVVEKLLID